jgi:hypothetical protein
MKTAIIIATWQLADKLSPLIYYNNSAAAGRNKLQPLTVINVAYDCNDKKSILLPVNDWRVDSILYP